MAYNAGLHEIMTTRLWDIHPMACQAYRQRMEANFIGHLPFVMERENDARPYMLSSREAFSEKIYVGDAERIQWRNDLDEEDRIINVIPMNGPVTRGGGACSYGSKDIRDMLIDAASQPQIIGHILVIDSPGGSAASKYDFEQGIAKAREAGQKVIACIDGTCASAAYALASLCDEIYFTHPNNEVGCIGTMAAFMISASGDENAITKERYVELYAEGSPYKNREFRAAAEGDYSLIEAELEQSARDFKEMVRKMRPQVTDEQLLGDTYHAGEVVGTLVDGRKNMEECVQRMLELCGYAEPSHNNGDLDDPEGKGDPQPMGPETDLDNNLKQTDMNKQYTMIQNALGVAELASDSKNALYLDEELCDVLEDHLKVCGQRSDALDAKMDENAALNARIAEMEKAHTEALDAFAVAKNEALEDLAAEKANEIEALKIEHQQAMEAKEAEMLKKENGLNAMMTELQGRIDELSQALEAKEKEIKELEKVGTEQPKAAAPKDNSVEAGANVGNRVCKEGMTAKERREALAKQWGKPRC